MPRVPWRSRGLARFEGIRFRLGIALAVALLPILALPAILSLTDLNPLGDFLAPIVAWIVAFATVMWVTERIVVRWLDYLERIAALYARGRYSVRPVQAAHAPSEVRRLAGTLDELAEAIATRDRSLTDSLSEKDALLREIHHRVKNNLQIISSLLSMQQRALKDEPAKAALGDTRQRISALALIYRTLYQSDDIRHADARDFMTELVGQLVASDSGRGPVVTSQIEADSLIVDPDKLAPLALWLVEAVTNAQKHAFAGRGGALSVRFRVQGETSVLEVEDDGPGPSDQSLQGGVGRTLMGAFAKQLRGEVEIVAARPRGTIARMTFATPELIQPTDRRDLEPLDAVVRPGTLSRASR
jgi:two-component sensor histidine kinase